MAHQVDVQVEGAGIAVVGSHHWGGVGNRGNSSVGEVGRGVGQIGSSMVASAGSKVVSTSCSNGRLINRNNSSVGMADKGGVQVERSRIAVGNNWSSVGKNRASMGKNRSNSVGGSKCCEVLSTGCGNCRLVNGNHCTIGVTNQAVEAGGGRGKSQGN